MSERKVLARHELRLADATLMLLRLNANTLPGFKAFAGKRTQLLPKGKHRWSLWVSLFIEGSGVDLSSASPYRYRAPLECIDRIMQNNGDGEEVFCSPQGNSGGFWGVFPGLCFRFPHTCEFQSHFD
jgi:hypothetical protein